MDYMQRLVDSTQDLPAFSPEREEIESLIFAESRQLAWDPEGRILVPEDLLAHANITETAAFVGKGQTFQIWEPTAHTALLADFRTRAQKTPPTLRVSAAPRTAPTNGGGS
jgi:MraZ protein